MISSRQRLNLVSVELADGFLRLPGDRDLPVGVAGAQQTAHLRQSLLAQALFGHGE